MSDISGAPSQVISLPKGGGALQGIGEKFAADLHTGTGNFTVPIALPPGRNGLQPGLSLVYSTGHGNGPFGLGWNLGLPGVSRQTAKGVPHYDDARDDFVLAGAEDLVPVAVDPDGTTHYRPRTEGIFARIEHHRDAVAGFDFWQVRGPDGLTSVYGTHPTGRPADAEADWIDPAVVADRGAATRVFAWNLTRTEDTFGNRIEYAYEPDLGPSGARHANQVYLRTIRYLEPVMHFHSTARIGRTALSIRRAKAT